MAHGLRTRAWFYALCVLGLTGYSTAQHYSVNIPSQPVHLQHSTDGDKTWSSQDCDQTVTFNEKTTINFPKQSSQSKCYCHISITSQTDKNNNDTLMIAWEPINGTSPWGDTNNKALTAETVTTDTLNRLKIIKFIQNLEEADDKMIAINASSMRVNVQPNQEIEGWSTKELLRSQIPLQIYIGSDLTMVCSNKKAPRGLKSLHDVQTSKEDIVKMNLSESDEDTIEDVEDDASTNSTEVKRQAFFAKQRPAHNNAIIIGIICTLIFVVVFASSLILVSLVLHRKRLARRLAVHLANIEQARRQESVPLTETPNKLADKRVRLLSIRRLSPSGIKKDDNEQVICSDEASLTHDDEETSHFLKQKSVSNRDIDICATKDTHDNEVTSSHDGSQHDMSTSCDIQRNVDNRCNNNNINQSDQTDSNGTLNSDIAKQDQSVQVLIIDPAVETHSPVKKQWKMRRRTKSS